MAAKRKPFIHFDPTNDRYAPVRYDWGVLRIGRLGIPVYLFAALYAFVTLVAVFVGFVVSAVTMSETAEHMMFAVGMLALGLVAVTIWGVSVLVLSAVREIRKASLYHH